MPVHRLPDGLVTFLFTDVEGSTRMARGRFHDLHHVDFSSGWQSGIAQLLRAILP